jgi:hypothetical protein
MIFQVICPLISILRTRPQIVSLLYDQLAAQCKQCGIRFADDSLGKRKMEDHLDMHFRQNRKANQNIGRGHSRSWFIGVEVRSSLSPTINCQLTYLYRIGLTTREWM